MNIVDIKKRLPARTLVLLGIGLLIALGFVAVFLVPEYREAERLRREIAVTRANLETRRQLEPVMKALREAESGMPQVGETGGAGRLALSDVGRLTDVFDGMATSLGLRVASVSPDASSVTKNGLLAVRLGLVGQADAFREFLLALGRYAPLVKIESANTMIGRDGREYSLKCWLAVQ